MQLRRFLPAYAEVLGALSERYPSNQKVNSLYHKDIVGRYVCRILDVFLRRKTAMLTEDYLGWVYTMMEKDDALGLFSVRAGQVFNILLYKIGNVKFSIRTYGFCSRVVSLFKK